MATVRKGLRIIDKLLVHIGYHKTGTTWLQRKVFPQSDLGLRVGMTKKEIHRLLVLPRALAFDAPSCRAKCEHLLQAGEGSGKFTVISSEELCGNPHGGAHLEKELAERLAATLPNPRILIAVREQRAMLASTYKQYIRAGATLSLGTYLNPPSLGDTRSGLPDWRHFRYHALIGCYRELFGAERVLVLPYELLCPTPHGVYQPDDSLLWARGRSPGDRGAPL